jgi:hypothetical protein
MNWQAQLAPTSVLAWAQPWLGMWRLTAATTVESVVLLAQLWDPRRFRASWSKELSESVDRYLRSPQFLEQMARNVKTMVSIAQINSQLRSDRS